MIDGLIDCKILGGEVEGDEARIDVEDELRNAKFSIYVSIVGATPADAELEVEVLPWVPRPPERRRS